MGKFKSFLKKYLPASSRTTNGRLDILEEKLAEINSYQENSYKANHSLLEETKQLRASLELKNSLGINRIEEKLVECEVQLENLLSKVEQQEEKIINIEKWLLKSKEEEKKIRDDIMKDIRKACEKRTSNRNNTDLVKQSWELAGLSTAKYINENMSKVQLFKNPAMLREYAISLTEIEGLYLEFGVYSGTSINQVADLEPRHIIYGFDSFNGLPETWRTGFYENKFAMDELPIVRENVRLEVGYFNETLPAFAEIHTENCAYVHVDCDLYSSTKTIFEILGDRFVPGTIIVFDEYFNYPSWQDNEFKAFQEYVKENEIEYEYLGYVPDWEQVAVKIVGHEYDGGQL